MPRSLTICLLAVAVLAVPAARAPEATIPPETDWDKMEKPTRALRNQLFKGDVRFDPSSKDHLAALDFAAQDVTSRLYWHRSAALLKHPDTDKSAEAEKERERWRAH